MEKRKENGGHLGPSNINIDLQLNLLSIWTKLKVSDQYQNIFLAHLDQLNNRQAQELIKKEISQTLQRKSFYFQLEKINMQRENILNQLKNLLQEPHKTISTEEFSNIFELLKQLRDTNLVAGEQILTMHKCYHCSGKEGVDKQMEYYDKMFDDLDRDNNFLKQTNLSNYFEFDQGYDPFLMAQYERISRNKSDNLNPSIKDFFNISISYAYRLMKTKNMILELRTSVLPQQDPSERLRTFELQNQFKVNDSVLSKKRGSYGRNQVSRDLNDEESLVTERMNLNDSLPVKIQPIHIFPSTHVKSRTTIYKEREDRSDLSNNDRIKQRLKLKFQKIPSRPNTNTNSTNYNVGNLLKNDRSNRLHLLTESDQIQPRNNLYQWKNSSFDSKIKRPFNDGDSLNKQQRKPLKYNAGVGQIYRSIKLSPITRNKYSDIQTSKIHNKSQFFNESQNIKELKSSQNKLRVSQSQERVPTFDSKRNEKQEINKSQIPVNQEYIPIQKVIKSYNPIKKQQFSLRQTQLKRSNKYDFNPSKISQGNGKHQISQIDQEDQEGKGGLIYEEPISKYNLKRSRRLKKSEPQNSIKKIEPKSTEIKNDEKVKEKANIPKIDQECQTIQMRKTDKNPAEAKQTKDKSNVLSPTASAGIKKQQQQISENSQSQPEQEQIQPQKKLPPKKTQFQDSDQTLEDEDIIDERPAYNKSINNKNLIRPVDKNSSTVKPVNNSSTKQIASKPQEDPKKVQNNNITKNESGRRQPINHNSAQQSGLQRQNSKKKQIRMKIGKISLDQFLKQLQEEEINEQYEKNIDFQKLKAWLKLSQTYLTEFYFGEQIAIIALCSPIPNIGMALKLWAPVSEEVDLNVSSTLFKKYIEFIEKSTTIQKIMYSGQIFKQLQMNDFTMKKQKMFERMRKLPPKENIQEFKPFLEIECSNIKFPVKANNKIFYSQEIQQFSVDNSFSSPFMAQANINSVPSPLQNIVKFNSKLPSFEKVNGILTAQKFDNYQVSQIHSSDIDLIRFYLHSSLKSTFIAQDGYFKFTGTLHHQKDNQCLVSLGIVKSNGIIYFCKNLGFNDMMQIIKKPPTSKVNFTVPMFSKKLYGMMPNTPSGCYGNWQINLTWQDEMQGRLKHNMKEAIGFGPGVFKVMLEIQKVIVCGFQVKKQDLII